MLDIKFVRENPEIVKQNIKNKFQDHKLPLVDEVIVNANKPKSIDNSRNNGFKCILCPPLYLNTLTIYIYVKINSLCFK